MICTVEGGSGVVVLFNDTPITEDVVEANEYHTTYFVIMNSSFVNNTNWVPANPYLELYNILVEAYDTEPILMTGGLSLAIYTGQRGYFVDVKVIDIYQHSFKCREHCQLYCAALQCNIY